MGDADPSAPGSGRQQTAMRILTGLNSYARTGQGDVKALEGDLAGLLRLRVGGYRVLFDETAASAAASKLIAEVEGNFPSVPGFQGRSRTDCKCWP